MDTSHLKAFAPAARRSLMEAVDRKLDVVLAARTPDYRTTFATQVAALGALARQDRGGLIERVAYTWFNRFTAIRYLDARGWHPFNAKVLMPSDPVETQPELLKLTRNGTLPDELSAYIDAERVNDILLGRIPSSDPQGEVYRYLVLAACRYYHALLPGLFESLDDETELLLPDDLLTEQSVVDGFRTEISDDDCAEVEVLGWLYQFYISEKKDEVMARKKAVPSEDIPAVTQLFTPHWIVRYLVENSLGRLWLLNRPGSRLREQMPYYIEGELEEEFLRIERPDEIRLIDPAVGSGHMLTYAFDLLYAIYEEEGYAPSEIAGMILKHNLYGVDIDQRAAQLALLALVLKARERSRRFFQPDVLVQPRVIALEDVRFGAGELREYVRALDLGELFDARVLELLGQFENATTFGSLIQPVLDERDIRQLRQRFEEKEIGADLLLSGTHQKVLRVLAQAEYLTQRYHIAVANPPYMGRRTAMNGLLKTFIASRYPHCKADVYAAFIQRCLDICYSDCYAALVTMQSWMFLSSYAGIREKVLRENTLCGLAQLGPRAFAEISGEVVQTAASIIRKRSGLINRPLFVNLLVGDADTKAAQLVGGHGRSQRMMQRDFLKLPGAPLVYWLQRGLVDALTEGYALEAISDQRQGLATGDDAMFLRYWHEVAASRVNWHATDMPNDELKWFPFIKGGGFRKWYGNNDSCIRFDSASFSALAIQGNCLPSRSFYLRESLTWSDITTAPFAARFNLAGKVFGTGALSAFPRDESRKFYILGYLNSLVHQSVMNALSSGMHYSVGYVDKSPIRLFEGITKEVETFARSAVSHARADWDSFEISWDFRDLPLLRPELKRATLAESWQIWQSGCATAIRRMQALETDNNRLWIEAYGLQDELSPEVPEEEITLARADQRKDVAAFLSYAVGCMMGRYSLHAPGLILADAGNTIEDYLAKLGKPLEALTFAPDADGIIPVLDGEWFEDDIVARTRDFLRASFGKATLAENLRFIEESLGKDLRSYFLTDFYKDHLQTYRKRPIYWMVQSPRKGFSALIYLHRYTRDTMNRVLNGYLREYETKLGNRIEHLARVQADPGTSTREQTAARKEADKLARILHECQEWERSTLLPFAQQRIDLDLDDGVKVNYQKLGEALAPIPGLASKDED